MISVTEKTEMVSLCCPGKVEEFFTAIKKKAKCSRYRPGVAQRVGRPIAVLFHDHGTRRV